MYLWASKISFKREVFVVSFWIIIATFSLWIFDKSELLSGKHQYEEVEIVDFPEVYQAWKRDEAMFVDGRSVSAFNREHIPGAINIPIGKVKERLALLPKDKDKRIIST